MECFLIGAQFVVKGCPVIYQYSGVYIFTSLKEGKNNMRENDGIRCALLARYVWIACSYAAAAPFSYPVQWVRTILQYRKNIRTCLDGCRRLFKRVTTMILRPLKANLVCGFATQRLAPTTRCTALWRRKKQLCLHMAALTP